MKILILDNYDSFTYNLVHIIRALDVDFTVVRNDKILLSEVGVYDKILLSPGPGIPDEAGIMKEIVRYYGPSKSILGICLGHQGIAEVYGGSLLNLPNVLHGVTSTAHVSDEKEFLFQNIPESFQVTHYHSWTVSKETLPPELKITAQNKDELILGIRHATYDVHGLQFHPESILTPHGPTIIKNWITK
jgi:anthranilate synthase component II